MLSSSKITQPTKTRLLKILVFATALFQIISPLIFKFRETNEQISRDPQFTPAGYTFAIWGVIEILALIYSIYQLLPNRKFSKLHQNIAPKLIALYLLFSFWLFSASKDWLIFTVIIFITMFILAYATFHTILKYKNNFSWKETILLEMQLGLYLGWPTVAIFANIGGAFKFYGITDLGTNGIIWQSILLIGALLNSIYNMYKTDSNYFLSCTILWAFIGVYFGLIQEPNNTYILKQIVLTAIIALFSSFFIIKKFKKQTLLAN